MRLPRRGHARALRGIHSPESHGCAWPGQVSAPEASRHRPCRRHGEFDSRLLHVRPTIHHRASTATIAPRAGLTRLTSDPPTRRLCLYATHRVSDVADSRAATALRMSNTAVRPQRASTCLSVHFEVGQSGLDSATRGSVRNIAVGRYHDLPGGGTNVLRDPSDFTPERDSSAARSALRARSRASTSSRTGSGQR